MKPQSTRGGIRTPYVSIVTNLSISQKIVKHFDHRAQAIRKRLEEIIGETGTGTAEKEVEDRVEEDTNKGSLI